MGMYDYLKISASRLPLSEEEKLIINDDTEWQTKDFDCLLTTVEITDEGKIRYLDIEYDWDDNAKGGLYQLTGQLGGMVVKEKTWKDIPYHGFVIFHKTINNVWYRFNAKFTDGQLTKVIRIYENNSN